MSAVLELARPDIRRMTAYQPDRIAGIWLDNNESPWPPVLETSGSQAALNRYPAPPRKLHRLLGEFYGVDDERVLATRGSDDGIDALIRCFCAAGEDGILVSPPTFGMYAVMANVQGARVLEVPLDSDFTYRTDAVVQQWDKGVKLVFVCSPNNPTGTPVAQAEISRLCEAMQGKAIVVVDEAYVEFTGVEFMGVELTKEGSAASLLDRFDNLVILRTLSKAFALAAVRCGVMLGNPEVLALVRKVLPPYLLPQPTVTAAEQVLAPTSLAEFYRRMKIIREERQRMRTELEALQPVQTVFPSAANFLLVRFENANDAATALAEAGVVVRRFNKDPLQDCLRISIGLPEENNRVLDALAKQVAA